MFDPKIHHRRSIRLQGYDYSQAGMYFITLCTQKRECLLGEIVDGHIQLNDAGRMVQTVWDEIPSHYSGADIDVFIAMPNHIHGIIAIVGAGPRACPDSVEPQANGQPQATGQPQGVAPTGLSLSDVVHRFKTMTTKRYADGVKQKGLPPFSAKLWQRNYWEHIIPNEVELGAIREYIQNNPAQWELDRLNLNQVRRDKTT